MKAGQYIDADILNSPLFVLEEIEKPTKQKPCQKQMLTEQELAQRRKQFLEDMDAYFADGSAKEVFANAYASICRVQDKGAFLFAYERCEKGQLGLGLHDEGVEAVCTRPQELFRIIACEKMINQKQIGLGHEMTYVDATPVENTDTTDYV